jgi:hypothetical protein
MPAAKLVEDPKPAISENASFSAIAMTTFEKITPQPSSRSLRQDCLSCGWIEDAMTSGATITTM